MCQIIVRENVEVSVVFASGSATPKAFIWEGRRLQVARVVRRWSGVHRSARLRYIDVETEDGARFVLCFDPVSVSWMAKQGGAQQDTE